MRKSFLLLVLIVLTASNLYAAPEMQEVLPMKLSIAISSDSGNYKLNATLYDNSSSRALVELLQKGPVTIDMHDYGRFEKVGELPKSLPRNDTSLTTEPGDIILYQGNKITIYYDKNSWTFTPLGKIDDVSKPELKRILGKGDVKAVLELIK